MMADEVSLGEVARSLSTFRDDTREDLANLGRRIDAKVRQDVYASDQAALRAFIAAEVGKVTATVSAGLQRHAEEIGVLKTAQDKARQQRWQVYVMVGGAILAALLPLVLTLGRAALTASGNG